MNAPENYGASRIKRRATAAEMEERAEFLIDYAREHGPVTVRGLYYQAEVHRVPGIDKSDSAYDKVQRQVLKLRREGRISYRAIADATRWMRKPRAHDSVTDALEDTARLYRKRLWNDTSTYVEIWCEKDALAGVIYPVTSEYDVPLMVSRGFCSETFAYEAIAQRGSDTRPYYVYYLGDFDRAGVDAARSLREKLIRFGDEAGIIRVVFNTLAVTESTVYALNLPTRPHKRVSEADKKWPYDFACELDAVPPGIMRAAVRAAIEEHIDPEQLAILRTAEASEREILTRFAALAERGAA
jgi:hypothetical protein